MNFRNFSQQDKLEIEKDIAKDFEHSLIGIKMLPMSSRLVVFMAYKYYTNLFKKIKKCKPEILMHKRISVSNARKVYLFRRDDFCLKILTRKNKFKIYEKS